MGALFFYMVPAQSPESDQHSVRSTMPTKPDISETRPRSGDSRASPAISEVLQIVNELAARRNANLFTGSEFTCPEFTWLDQMRQFLRSAENHKARHCMKPRNRGVGGVGHGLRCYRPEPAAMRENRLAGLVMLALPLHEHG